MEVIPAINCKDFKCVKAELKKAAKFLPKGGWVQIDISDGKFTGAKTWNNPRELKNLQPTTNNLNIEIHLMTENPEKVVPEWLKAGAKRIIFHIEAMENSKILKYKNKIGLAINPNTSITKLFPYLNKIKFIQFLAVNPGFSGQKFDKRILKKIKSLKSRYPKIKIEVDGGINLKTARLVKKAGADIIVSGSYIWKSKNPKKAYQALSDIK